MDDAELGWAREDAFVSVGLGFVFAEDVFCCAGRCARELAVLMGAALALLRIAEPIGVMGDAEAWGEDARCAKGVSCSRA
jgi:hypothetical protein